MARYLSHVSGQLLRRQICAAALGVAMMGCASWTRIPDPAPAGLPPSTHFQVWLGRRAVVLREVTIEADSVRGREIDPPGARRVATVAFPRSDVDSFRMHPPDPDNWFGAGVAAGLLAGIAVTWAFFRAALGD